MTDVSLSDTDEAQVVRAMKLLQMRQEDMTTVKHMAVQRAIQKLPPEVVNRAQVRLTQGSSSKSKKKVKKQAVATPPQAKFKSASLIAQVLSSDTQAGHAMMFEMTIELPKKVQSAQVGAGEGGFARDLYGAFFEWWEEIILDYNFTEPPVGPNDEDQRQTRIAQKKQANAGGENKPWSDIYLSNPTSMTFYSWRSTLEEAAAGKLKGGVVKPTVQDNPYLNFEEGSFKRRTLRFRISAGDAGGEVFQADAIQVVTIEDGKLLSSLYQDSLGNELKSGSGDFEAMRYRSKVGVEVRHTEGSDFIVALETDKENCQRFVDTELEQVQQAAAARQAELGIVHKDVNQGNKMNVLPLIPSSDEYWQRPASDGGLLVAQVSGGKVKRLYHTDDDSREIEVGVKQQPVKFTVRTFEQLPLR